ncbi:MAG: response regulator [Planctomycetes bacterium]|nr:response regulator [Planctomycetota bacterium]
MTPRVAERPRLKTRPAVLLVAQDPAVQSAARQAFPPDAFELTVLPDFSAAQLALSEGFVHAVVVDLAASSAPPAEFVPRLRGVAPDTEIVLLADTAPTLAASVGLHLPCLPRPPQPAALRAVIEVVLDRQRLALQHRVLVEGSVDPILTRADDGTLLRWNPAAERIFGYSPEEALGRPITLLLPEGFPGLSASPDKHSAPAGGSTEVECKKKDGSLVPTYLNFATSLLQGKRVWTAHFSDASTEKQLRAQLLQAEKLSSVGELIAGVAHELNNPLSGVVGYSQLLLARAADDELRRDLERISKEAERCRKIVLNLLTFARKHKPERTRVNLNDIVDSILDLRGYELRVSNIEVVRELDPKLPPTLADFHQLQQVFLNIVNNAQYAMQEANGRGKITLSTSRIKDPSTSLPILRVAIQDDGPGISQANLRKIFDPFFTTKPVGKGTGLGLSVCFGIVREHGGRIYARSEEGKGSTFMIEIPWIDPSGPEGVALRKTLSPTPISIGVLNQRVTGCRVLVVDDEETVRDLISDVLSMQGHDVAVAASGNMALSIIGREEFDLVVSDLMMPGMTGRVLHSKVKDLRPLLARRMVFVTGDTLSADTQAFFQEIGACYLAKPFTIEEVEAVVQRALAAT